MYNNLAEEGSGGKEEKMSKKSMKYSSDIPRKMYVYFSGYDDPHGAPSFGKFARSIGARLEDLKSFRRHREFEAAYLECSEIRRDYLIDNALTKRFDPSMVKFLIDAESDTDSEPSSFTVRLEVAE